MSSKAEQMIRKSFPFEKTAYFIIITASFIKNSSLIQFDDHQQYGILALKILILLLKFLIEGAKPLDGLYILAVLAGQTQMLLAEAVVMVALTFAITYFYFYEISIIHKGKYNVGYKHAQIQAQKLGVFYPTNETGQLADWVQSEIVMRRFYDLTFINPLKPRWVPWFPFKFFTSFMTRAKMPAVDNANILIDGEMDLVIFSHGLSSTMNSHSSYCSWLASQGYIVVSIQHDHDLVRFSFDQHLFDRAQLLTQMLYLLRNRELKIRSQQMERIYLSAIQGDLMSTLFPLTNIVIKNIHLAGHSFGGSTCLQAMINIQKKEIPSEKIQNILCIDPWVFPLSRETLLTKIEKPVKFINSESFIDRLPKQFRMRENLSQLKIVNGENLQAVVLMGSDHIFSVDVLFVCGNGVGIISKVKHYEKTQYFFEILQKTTIEFFQRRDQNTKNNKKTIQQEDLRQQWRYVNPEL